MNPVEMALRGAGEFVVCVVVLFGLIWLVLTLVSIPLGWIENIELGKEIERMDKTVPIILAEQRLANEGRTVELRLFEQENPYPAQVEHGGERRAGCLWIALVLVALVVIVGYLAMQGGGR
jgi:hypothetical protein